MAKKLTINVDDEVYEDLDGVIGARWISRFSNDLVRPHVTACDLVEGYRAMAADEEYERRALEWIGNLADLHCRAVLGSDEPEKRLSGRRRPSFASGLPLLRLLQRRQSA